MSRKRKKGGRKFLGLKAFGADVTPEMLAKINGYALTELTVDDVYVRKVLLAHNAVDRDNERFPEKLLEDFASTLPGKGLLMGHARGGPGMGLFFDSSTEEISPAEFKDMTGEEPRLPEGVSNVRVLWGWFYMVKDEVDATARNIDAGIFRHVSIGFRATDIMPVKDDVNGSVKYWEYVPPGEATEGSLVWLGAQPGATVQKYPLFDDEEDAGESNAEKEGRKRMEFLKRISQALGKVVSTEDEAVAAITAVKQDLASKDERVKELEPIEDEVKGLRSLKEKVGDTDLDEMKQLAEEGKAYRQSLVEAYVKHKAKLGECKETEEAQQGMKKFAGGFDIEFLKSEVEHLKKRVAEKFPDKGQVKGGDPEGERDKSREEQNENAFVPKEEKEG